MPRRRTAADHSEPSADDTAPAVERPSKTQLKTQAHDLQKLGRALADLSDVQLARIDMPEELRAAIDDLRRTRSHEGRRRQLQLVGKRMRQVDAKPLQEALSATQLGSAKDALTLHKAEYWREALVTDDTHLTRFAAEHPALDLQQLRALVRRARGERAEQATTPEGATRYGKAWRELFQFIRPAIQTEPSSEA